MPSQEDIRGQLELLAAHRQTLSLLLRQKALIGLVVPPSIVNGINEHRTEIRRIKASLRAWGISAQDHPDDEPLSNDTALDHIAAGDIVVASAHFIHRLLRARDWQNRPEFDHVCDWWRCGGTGVCALVGIGGAGKTAITERFLQVLPGGIPEHPKVPKHPDLMAPTRLFVFSFYEASNADSFFIEFASWLGFQRYEAQQQTASYQQILERLTMVGTCLLVLDGMEKVQNDGTSGGALGQILDGRLKDLVLRTADGWLPHVSLLITSRFRLYDPLATRTYYYNQINVERLQPHTAVQLLRDRGVTRGTDEQLERIAREQGFHALSVDLVGGYIARFCDGNPEQLPPYPKDQSVSQADALLDPLLAAIREQERKFARLTQRYHEALSQSDPAALSLLQRICLFRLGVDASILSSIFTGEGKEGISGQHLAGLSNEEINQKLALLTEMRLLEASRLTLPNTKNQTRILYTIHPAVRDGFLSTLDAETTRVSHDAVREGLLNSLIGLPGMQPLPSDPAMLDLLEEIIYHAVEAGYVRAAFAIYNDRMGGGENICNRLGEYERGERICRTFIGGVSPMSSYRSENLSRRENYTTVLFDLSPYNWGQLLDDWGRYLFNLGRLDEAGVCSQSAAELFINVNHWEGVSGNYGQLADVSSYEGKLYDAVKFSTLALEYAKKDRHNRITPVYIALRAFGYFLRGSVKQAMAGTEQAVKQTSGILFMSIVNPFYIKKRRTCIKKGYVRRKWPTSLRRQLGDDYHISWVETIYISLLIRLGNDEFADRLLRTLKQDEVSCVRCKVHLWRCLVELALLRHDASVAAEWLTRVYEWAVEHDAKDDLCWYALARAQLIMGDGTGQRSKVETQEQQRLRQCRSVIEEGLHVARYCGFGIYYIDLLLLRADLALCEGRTDDALHDVKIALQEGLPQDTESGLPKLLAAIDPECGYAWGIAEGCHLLGEALLLQAAQQYGRTTFNPAQFDQLPDNVGNLIEMAREHLTRALDQWRSLRDPASNREVHPRGQRTQQTLKRLKDGVLTYLPSI